MSVVQIRLAIPGDLRTVSTIATEAYAPYIAVVGRPPAPMTEDYGALIEKQAVHVLTLDDEVVGFIVLIFADDHLLLDNVAVLPRARGVLAARFLPFVEQMARSRGVRRLRLYTNVVMTRNIALYERLGFAEVERKTQQGFERVYMEKTL